MITALQWAHRRSILKDLGKFIGIPHYFGKSSFEQCDCAGFARLFYREHGWAETLTDNKPEDVEEYKRQPLRMLRYLMKNLDRIESIDALEYGDIVVTKVLSEHHVGIYTEYQRLLTMEVPVIYGVTKSCIYKGHQWMPYFVMGFRRR